MTDKGMGVGAFKRDLYTAQPGSKFGPQERYQVVGLVRSTENSPFPVAFASYLAKDLEHSRFVIVRVLGATDSESMVDTVHMNNSSGRLLLPLDSFTHQSGTTFQCFVYELHSTDLYHLTNYMGEDANLPANWIWKVFKESLAALADLHKQDIVHGSVQLTSFVITYPKLDSTGQKAVEAFYCPLHKSGFALNATGSGRSDAATNLEFEIKLQDFGQAFHTKDGVTDVSKYLLFACPPPELAIHHKAGPETDIWYLAGMMTNFIAGMLCSASVLPVGHDDHVGKLGKVQQILGPLPTEYQKNIPQRENSTKGYTSLLDAIQIGRREYRNEEASLEDYGSKDFSDEEARLAADLLSHMLDYDPKSRYTAEQALNHEFFQASRPS